MFFIYVHCIICIDCGCLSGVINDDDDDRLSADLCPGWYELRKPCTTGPIVLIDRRLLYKTYLLKSLHVKLRESVLLH